MQQVADFDVGVAVMAVPDLVSIAERDSDADETEQPEGNELAGTGSEPGEGDAGGSEEAAKKQPSKVSKIAEGRSDS